MMAVRARRRLLRPVVVLLALLWLLHGLHPATLHITHASFHHAWCACPLCVIHDGMTEVSYGEYC